MSRAVTSRFVLKRRIVPGAFGNHQDRPERVVNVDPRAVVNDHENSPGSIMGIPHPWVTENRL
jgi:hypothetical protein